MSVSRDFYVIAGYDLTGWDTDKLRDWKWEEGEEYICNHSKGNIQLFDDPMSDSYLYFGYVLARNEMYEDDEVSKFKVDDITRVYGEVKSELIKLQELGVITKDPKFVPEYQIISFVECS